jgi:hypothetical protein
MPTVVRCEHGSGSAKPNTHVAIASPSVSLPSRPGLSPTGPAMRVPAPGPVLPPARHGHADVRLHARHLAGHDQDLEGLDAGLEGAVLLGQRLVAALEVRDVFRGFAEHRCLCGWEISAGGARGGVGAESGTNPPCLVCAAA